MTEQDFTEESSVDTVDIDEAESKYASLLADDEDSEAVLETIEDDDDSDESDDDDSDESDEEDSEDFDEDYASDFENMDLSEDFDEDNDSLEDTDSPNADVALLSEGGTALEIPELTVEQAQELTEHIRSTSDVLYVLVARAHAGKAHKAMGYSDFGAYVKAEFDISRSRAYQFINQANVIQAIEESTPEGTQFKLSEAAARDLKNYVEELAPEIRDATKDLDPSEAGAVVEEMVSDYRDKLNQENNDFADTDFDLDFGDVEYDAPSFDGEGGSGGGSQFDDMENFDNLDDFDPNHGDSDDRAIDIEEASVFRKKLEDVYAFYTALSSLEQMPDVQDIIDSVQESRRSHLNTSLPKAKAWLDAMHEAWFSGENAQEATDMGATHEDEDIEHAFDQTEGVPQDADLDFERLSDDTVSDYTEESDFGEKSDIN